MKYLPVASGFLVLVLSLAVGVLTVTSNKNQGVSTKAANETAALSLSPSGGDYTFDTETSYPVGIILNTGGKTIDGVDVVISFDPKKVQVETLTLANDFEQYPVNKVDNSTGKIRLSGLTFTPKAMAGVMGTFRFHPVARGAAGFTFDFTPGSTTDSNVADQATAKDILGTVTNAGFTFK